MPAAGSARAFRIMKPGLASSKSTPTTTSVCAHRGGRARYAIGHELDRVDHIEFFANNSDRAVAVPGKRLGEHCPCITDRRNLALRCGLHFGPDTIDMDVKLVLSAPIR